MKLLSGVRMSEHTFMPDPDNNWIEKVRPHYYDLGDGLDVIDIIDRQQLNFQRGSAVKYIMRAGKKPGTSEIVELRKAIECLTREIARLESADLSNKVL